MRYRRCLIACWLVAFGVLMAPQFATELNAGDDKEDKAEKEEKRKEKPNVRPEVLESTRKKYARIAKMHDSIEEMYNEVEKLKGIEDERQKRSAERKIEMLMGRIRKDMQRLAKEVEKERRPLEKDRDRLKESEAAIEQNLAKEGPTGRRRDKFLQDQATVFNRLRSLTMTLDCLDILASPGPSADG